MTGNKEVPSTATSRTIGWTLLSLIIVFLVTDNVAAKTKTLTNGKQSITIDYSHKLNYSEQLQTHYWLQDVTDSLLMVYGEWPKDEFEIKVSTTTRGSGPVPWGQVNRDQPDRVSLFINPEYGFDAVAEDWTVYHELSHLLIPYQGFGDLWISEGLASYYQNILQARSGKLNQEEFWMKLISGFERGQKQTNWSTIRLSKVSDNMRRYRNFMRVHWSGVLFWLTADINIREASNNKHSLDSLLKQLKNCCEQRAMSSRSIMHKLDELYGSKVFTPLFYEFRNSYRMPEYQTILRKIGIDKKTRRSKLVINKEAKLANLGEQIFQGTMK